MMIMLINDNDDKVVCLIKTLKDYRIEFSMISSSSSGGSSERSSCKCCCILNIHKYLN